MKTPWLSVLLLAGAGAVVPALGVEIQLPPETATYKASPLPGYVLVQRNCMSCHSADYARTQPPTSPRSYWEATVKKMKRPFGAQFDDADIPAMVEYLAKVYGAEQGNAGAVTASTAATAATAGSSGTVNDARSLLAANNCLACHTVEKSAVGPAYKAVADKYAHVSDAEAKLARNIRAGGAGKWGPVPMPPFTQLTEDQARTLARYVLSQ